MFSRLRAIIWPCATGTTISSPASPNIKTIDSNSKGNYTNTGVITTTSPSPQSFVSRLEEDQKIMTSTRTRLLRNDLPRLTISVPETNKISVGSKRAFAIQKGHVKLCSHTRKVRWADPLVSAVSADLPTRAVDSPSWSADLPTRSAGPRGFQKLSWGNPLITKVSVEPPHAPPVVESEGVVSPSSVPASYCSHEETSGLVRAISGLILRDLVSDDYENEDVSPLELDIMVSDTETDFDVETTTRDSTKDTINDSSVQNVNISIIETR